RRDCSSKILFQRIVLPVEARSLREMLLIRRYLESENSQAASCTRHHPATNEINAATFTWRQSMCGSWYSKASHPNTRYHAIAHSNPMPRLIRRIRSLRMILNRGADTPCGQDGIRVLTVRHLEPEWGRICALHESGTVSTRFNAQAVTDRDPDSPFSVARQS